MGLFSGCMLACDIDGTLMVNGFINERNVERIDFFVNEGGCFSVSTGRSVDAVAPVLAKIKNISPSVVANGCMLYDFKNKKVLDQLFIDKNDYGIAEKVLNMGLNVGIEVHSENNVLTVKKTKETEDHQKYEWISGIDSTYAEAAKYNWNKAIYLFDNLNDLNKVKAMIKEQKTASVFVDTSAEIDGRKRIYYEQFPSGVSKYTALEKLCGILKIKSGCLFAMGDYYNDLEMIKKADVSAVPADAPEEIRACADFVAGRCEDGAVADFIDYLLKNREEW